MHGKMFSKLILVALLGSCASLLSARTIHISKSYGPFTGPPFAEQTDSVNDVWRTNTLVAITHPNLIYNVPATSPGDLEIIFDDSSTYTIASEMTAFEPDYFYRKTLRWEMGNAGGSVKYPNVIMKAADGQTPTIDYSGLPSDNQIGGRNAIQILHVNPANRTFTFQGIRFVNRDVNESAHISSAAIRLGGNGTIILKDCVSETVTPILHLNKWDDTESPDFINTVPEIEHCAFTVLKGNVVRIISPIMNFESDGEMNVVDSTFVVKAQQPDSLTTITTAVIAELAPAGIRPNATYVTTNTIIRNFTNMMNQESGFTTSTLTYNHNIDFPAVIYKAPGAGNLTVDPQLVSDFPTYLINFATSPAVGAGVGGTTIGYAKQQVTAPTAVRMFELYE